MLVTFNEEEDYNSQKTYKESVILKFQGYGLLLKLNSKRQDKENTKDSIWL